LRSGSKAFANQHKQAIKITIKILMRIAATENVPVVHADEKLTAFVELERAIHEFAVSLIS